MSSTRTRAPAKAPAGNGRANPRAKPEDVWYDHDAELHLLADLIVLGHHVPEAMLLIQPGELSGPHGNVLHAIYQAHSDGDGVTTAEQLAQLDGIPDHLPDLLDGMFTGAWRRYARRLTDLAHRRHVTQIALELKDAANAGAGATITHLAERLTDIDRAAHALHAAPSQAVDIDDLLGEDEPDYDWLVPGLLERADRLIVTAGEGAGKSTLLRQIAFRVACGQDPFTGAEIAPVRVTYIDIENSRSQVRRQVRYLRLIPEADYRPGHLRFEFRPNGLDLLDPVDVAWLDQVVHVNQPDLLVIGPLYKMASGDPRDEIPARAVSHAIDELRARTGVTMIIEAHTPYADGPKSKRPIRPYGASLWSRWPEFGWCLTDTGKVEHWRGPRDQRVWPEALDRSSPWLWAPRDMTGHPDEPYEGPTHCADAIVELLETDPYAELSTTALYDRLKAAGRGFRKSTVGPAAELAVNQGRIERRTGARNANLYRLAGTQQTLDGPPPEDAHETF